MFRKLFPALVVALFSYALAGCGQDEPVPPSSDNSSMKATAPCPTGWLGPYTTTVKVVLECDDEDVPVTVTYCIPGKGLIPLTQYKITSVSGVPDECIFWANDMREIGRKLIEQNPAKFVCGDECPFIFPQWSVGWAHCWFGQGSEEKGLEFFPCNPDPNAEACVDLYHVCCACDGSLTPYYQGSTPSGVFCDESSGDPGCLNACPDPKPTEPVQCP